jgi:hypothetical protein
MDNDPEEKNRKWLTSFLDSGACVDLFVQHAPDLRPLSLNSTARSAVRHLYPFIESGQLKIFVIPPLDGDEGSKLPRVWTKTGNEGAAWFTGTDGTPMLKAPLPEPVYRCDLSSELVDALDVLADATRIMPEHFQIGMPIEMWDLPRKQVGRVTKVFEDLRGMYIESLIIKDPYVSASEKNMESLCGLLTELIALTESIESIEITAKELHWKDKNFERFDRVQADLCQRLEKVHPNAKAKVLEFKRAYGFHDRTIDARVLDAEGCAVTIRYDLTGGVDHLMDLSRETKVFRYALEN